MCADAWRAWRMSRASEVARWGSVGLLLHPLATFALWTHQAAAQIFFDSRMQDSARMLWPRRVAPVDAPIVWCLFVWCCISSTLSTSVIVRDAVRCDVSVSCPLRLTSCGGARSDSWAVSTGLAHALHRCRWRAQRVWTRRSVWHVVHVALSTLIPEWDRPTAHSLPCSSRIRLSLRDACLDQATPQLIHVMCGFWSLPSSNQPVR